MRMRESLTPTEWGRLRNYCGDFTQAEIERAHYGKLGEVLANVAAGRPLKKHTGDRLSTQAITQALKWCKQAPGANGPGRVEEIQE